MTAERNLWKGLAAGAAGGLVASVVMNQFQSWVGQTIAGSERSHGAQSLQQGSPDHGAARELKERGSEDETDDAAMRLANVVSEGVFEHGLSQHEKQTAGTAVHYVFGVTTGAWYGAAAEAFPVITAGGGLPFGGVVWLTADEGLVPALGLSKSPSEYPLSIHAYAFASHLVYGLTTELVRRAVRRAL